MTTTQKIKLGLKTLGRVVYNALFLRTKSDLHLNLGAGGTRMGVYINVDSLFMRETDLLCTLKHLPFFVRSGSVSCIYASHVLEHFTRGEVQELLILFRKLLSNGGELRISVPDFEKVATLYLANREEFRAGNPLAWQGVVFGGQTDKYDFHKIGFTATVLGDMLHEAGFADVQEYDAEAFLAPYNVRDSSLYKKEFKEYISLNMVATRISAT